MKIFLTILLATSAVSALSIGSTIPSGAKIVEAPASYDHVQKDNWGNNVASQRRRVTIRSSRNDTDDVSSDFLWGINAASHGGLLHLEKGKTYVIGTKLDLPVLDDVYVKLDGEIKFTDDIEYWQTNNFYYDFQKSITFWVWSGNDIKIYGSGTLNGNGQSWYDGFAGLEILDTSNTYYRPILFLTDNATNVEVTGITQLNSPCWTNFFVRTNNITFDNVYIEATSNNASALPKNTDGFDSINVQGLTVTNTRVNVGDDCFSPKSNTSDIFVQNLWCNGTHGVSMGSIGQYENKFDYIANAYIKNVTLLNGQNGARLKAWAGMGVGYGFIDNVTYEDVYIENTDHPVVLDQCYFDVNATECAAHPSNVNITNIMFKNITGSSSGSTGRVVADLTCSPGATCANITLVDINISSPVDTDGEGSQIVCDNIVGGIGVDCISSADADFGD